VMLINTKSAKRHFLYFKEERDLFSNLAFIALD
jgi:hypothetical protein